MLTKWTGHRLKRLYEDYKKQYWNGKLCDARIVIRPIKGSSIGCCEPDFSQPDKPFRFLITIDVAAHKTDQRIISTLLHECCHVAIILSARRGHGIGFSKQIEQLFIKGAPIELHQARYLKGRWFQNLPLLHALEPLMLDAISAEGSQTWAMASCDAIPLWQLLDLEESRRSRAVKELIEKCKRAHRRAHQRFLAEARAA
jgi:hypothetical protein